VAWQDLVLCAGNLVFMAAMLPLFKRTTRVSRWASVPKTVTLATFVVAYASMGLWATTAGVAMGAVAWGFVGWRRAA
jgi:hypothetical protein